MSSKSKNNPKVSVVIPNWNGQLFLKKCLTSLSKQSFKDFEVILVDNGSEDRSVSYTKRYFSKTQIVQLDKNYGFAKPVNEGIKISKGTYIFLLNNDTEVDKDCLKYLVKVLDQKKTIGMVAAKMLNFYNRSQIDSTGDYIDAVGHADNRGLNQSDGKEFNKEEEIFLVSGGGSLIRKLVFEKVGLLDEDYFAYFEDVDFCFRAQLQGFKAYFQPKAIIYHIHKATSNRNKPFTEYLQFRNMTMTVIKNFPKDFLLYDSNWLKILLVNINTIRYMATKGYLKEALQAEWFILKNIAQLLEKRNIIQATQKVSSEYIIKQVRPKKVTVFGLFSRGL